MPKSENNSNRRDFIKNMALLAGSTAAASHAETVLGQQNESANVTVKYGGTNVYYGPQHPKITQASGQYDCLVVEPGNFAKAPKNCIAYVPLSGLNENNLSHKALFKEIMGSDGFLRDKSGRFLEDPQGPGTFFIDWRKPEVQKVMAKHIKSLTDRGFKGVMFDAIDSVIMTENKDPDHFGKGAGKHGLTQSAMVFAYNAKASIKKINPKAEIVVNGGISSAYGGNDESFDVKKAIGMTADKIMVESQYSLSGKPRNNDNDKAWLVGQLSEVAKHAKGNFGFAIVDPGWVPMTLEQGKKTAEDAMKFTKEIAQEVSENVNQDRAESAKVKIDGSVVCTSDYTNPDMCVGNARLAGLMNVSARGRR